MMKAKCMKIIFDFDYTLFNTKKFYKALQINFKKLGINKELFSETYKKSKKKRGYYQPLKQFNLITKEKTGLSLELLEKSLKKTLSQTNQFLYSDVESFLKKINKNFSCIILSFGVSEIQKEKIKNLKIANCFEKIIIAQDIIKVKGMKQLLKKQEAAIFIDDNPRALFETKKVFPNLITVRINRGAGGYFQEPNNKKIDYFVQNLREFKKILKTYEKD